MNDLTAEEQKKVEELRTAIAPHAAVGSSPQTFPSAHSGRANLINCQQ